MVGRYGMDRAHRREGRGGGIRRARGHHGDQAWATGPVAPHEHHRAFVATTGTAAASTPTRTPTPTHTPVITTRDEAVTEPVPFERASVDDSTMPQGQTAVTTAGQNGERTRTYRVTLTDGKETKRELVSDAVTVPPVTEVTSVGTYVEPAAPPPPAAAPGGC